MWIINLARWCTYRSTPGWRALTRKQHFTAIGKVRDQNVVADRRAEAMGA